jgi:hypothetical protein
MAAQLMSDDIESVCRSVVHAAKAGDMTAARLIIERILPAPRTRRIALDLPPVKTASDIHDAKGRVIAAMSAGDISADEAMALSSVLDGHRKSIETVELEARIATLEAGRGK